MSDHAIEYLNNEERWPADEWPEGGPDHGERCQYEFGRATRCGLPRYLGSEQAEARCIFHYEGERDPGELQRQLEKAADRGALLWEADLEDARLFGAKLQNAQLMDANLQNAFLVRADLHDADLTDTNLENADLRFTNLQGADLTDASLEGKVDLRRANLSNARLSGVQLDQQSRLDHVTWADDGSIVLRDEREARAARKEGKREAALPLFRTGEMAYRKIKQSYHESGDYQTAGEFFIREMECKRAQMSIGIAGHPQAPWYQRLAWWLMYRSFGYGERPWWLVEIAVLLVLIFATIQAYFCGFTDTARNVQIGPGVAWPPTIGGVFSFLNAVYFSVVTFTGLGYGDMQPATGISKTLAGIEVVIGLLTMSLILITIVRKWTR